MIPRPVFFLFSLLLVSLSNNTPLTSNAASVTTTTTIPCTYTFPRPAAQASSFHHHIHYVLPAINLDESNAENTRDQFVQWLAALYIALTHHYHFVYDDPFPWMQSLSTFLGFGANELQLYDVDRLHATHDRLASPTRVRVDSFDELLKTVDEKMASFGKAAGVVAIDRPDLRASIVSNSTWMCEPSVVRELRRKYCMARVARSAVLDLYERHKATSVAQLEKTMQNGHDDDSNNGNDNNVRAFHVAIHVHCPASECGKKNAGKDMPASVAAVAQLIAKLDVALRTSGTPNSSSGRTCIVPRDEHAVSDDCLLHAPTRIVYHLFRVETPPNVKISWRATPTPDVGNEEASDRARARIASLDAAFAPLRTSTDSAKRAQQLRDLSPHSRVRTHFHVPPSVSLHHLITADLLVANSLGPSLVAALLRPHTTLLPSSTYESRPCERSVLYNDDGAGAGEFDVQALRRALRADVEQRSRAPLFLTRFECVDIE